MDGVMETTKLPEWSEIFELGVPEIDADHRKMFALARDVGLAIAMNDHEKCAALTAQLVALARDHFEREEGLLRGLGYYDLEEHIRYHAALLDQAEAMRQACAEMKGQAAVEECFRNVMGFLIDDIIRGDFGFKSFLEENGVTRR